HVPLEARHGTRNDAARQPYRGDDDHGQGDSARYPERRVGDLPAYRHVRPLERAGTAGRGRTRGRRGGGGRRTAGAAHAKALPTGRAVPETRRTSSRAATLVSSVMAIRASPSSAWVLMPSGLSIAESRFCTMLAAIVIMA